MMMKAPARQFMIAAPPRLRAVVVGFMRCPLRSLFELVLRVDSLALSPLRANCGALFAGDRDLLLLVLRVRTEPRVLHNAEPGDNAREKVLLIALDKNCSRGLLR